MLSGMNLCDKLVNQFFDDVKMILEKEDLCIRNKFIKSELASNFYKDRWKGIGTWSITEPIIKFIIFKELCDKYKIRPEDNAYNNSKFLDLAIYLDEENETNHAEIGIELKWVSITKQSKMSSQSLQNFADDFVKIKNSKTKNNYLMQFGFVDRDIEIDICKLENQVSEEIDGRLLRKFVPMILAENDFTTWASNEYDLKKFILIMWKVVEKNKMSY